MEFRLLFHGNPLTLLAQTCESIGKDLPCGLKAQREHDGTPNAHETTKRRMDSQGSQSQSHLQDASQASNADATSKEFTIPLKKRMRFDSASETETETNKESVKKTNETMTLSQSVSIASDTSSIAPASDFDHWLRLLAGINNNCCSMINTSAVNAISNSASNQNLTPMDGGKLEIDCEKLQVNLKANPLPIPLPISVPIHRQVLKCLWIGCGACFLREEDFLWHLKTHALALTQPLFNQVQLSPLSNPGTFLLSGNGNGNGLGIGSGNGCGGVGSGVGVDDAEISRHMAAFTSWLRSSQLQSQPQPQDPAGLLYSVASPFPGISLLPNLAWSIPPLGLSGGFMK